MAGRHVRRGYLPAIARLAEDSPTSARASQLFQDERRAGEIPLAGVGRPLEAAGITQFAPPEHGTSAAPFVHLSGSELGLGRRANGPAYDVLAQRQQHLDQPNRWITDAKGLARRSAQPQYHAGAAAGISSHPIRRARCSVERCSAVPGTWSSALAFTIPP